ncbi:DUF4136 domain-containing protein [Agarivorans sp. Toyoura001]|uniref:DUF4136 domain-containing protein n=1 Tax=unclassified Agarivorans TaxID=2636026 RepID=UPI0010D78A24|nr:DUF4136 domain-containing protein [Agarivorans sp. Toyoura001]GDY26160.1 hypothetical protein AHAT_20500 [Agarivorans sp. Toyoura001]
MYRLFIIACLSFTAAACTIKPAVDYNIDQDFSQYKDFAFAPMPEDAVASIDGQRIERELDSQLKAKGLQVVELEQADLLVDYRIDTATELESYGGSFSVGVGRKHGAIGVSSPDRYKERKYGKLVVEFLDPETKALVWRSISQSQLRETMGPESRAKFINEQVALMLENYPPKAK